MSEWKLVYKSSKYYYWKHRNKYYNCTVDNEDPLVNVGYVNYLWLR